MTDEALLDQITALTEEKLDEVLRIVGVGRDALPSDEEGRTAQARALIEKAREKDATLAALRLALGKIHPPPIEARPRLPGGGFMLMAALCFALLGFYLLDRFAGSTSPGTAYAPAPVATDGKY